MKNIEIGNAAFEMSIWLVISTIFLVQLQFDTINSISTAYHHSESGRKLFGGYRIVPRPCTASTDGKRSEPKTGVCMFNYECNQSGGEMIGSCIDGFLFGVCCSLPQSMNHIQIENDNVNHFGSFFNTLSTSSPSPSPSPSGSLPSLPSLSSLTSSLNKRPGLTNNKIKVDGISTTKMPPTHSVPVRRPILEHYFGNQTHGGFIDNEGFLPLHAYPVADTILLNPDGTLVDDDKNPEKIFTPQHPHQSYSPSRPTPPTLNHHSQSHLNYGYVVGGDFYTMNTMNTMNKQPPNKVQSPISAVTQGVDMTVSNVHQITTKLTSDQLSGRPTQPQGIYSYVTQRPTLHSPQQNPLGSSSSQSHLGSQNSQTHLSSQNSQTHMGSQNSQSYLGPQSSQSHMGPQSTQSYLGSQSPQSQSHMGSQSPQGSSPVTFVRYPSPGMYTTASMFNKKTDMLPLPSTTSRPNPSYVIADDNLILLQTFTSQNKIKHPTTRIPTESTQVTRKSSNKPVHVTTKMPVKTTTSSYDLDDKYSSYNYNFYTGSSKPPILISHPVGLDDNGQAISHILGILNTTEPDPETVTQTSNSDGALSTWVSILGDEKPLKNKNPKPSPTKPTPTKTSSTKPSPTKPSPTKPASTATTYVHGPSYTVTSGDNKPAPTVLVIHDVAGTHGPTTKPTKRPVSGVVSHSTNKITIKNPNKPSPSPKPKPTKPTKPTHFEETEVYHTGQENLVNFPPVRNPEILNASGLNQMEKPTLVHTYVSGQDEVLHLPNGITLDVVPDNVDLNTIDTEEEDYDDITTPSLQEDKVEGQVHVFVEKIVNSLSGNFQDLEQLLFKNENKSSIANPNGIQLNNIYVGEDIDRITTEDYTTIITSTRKPSRRPTTIRPDFYDTTIQETSVSQPQKRPKPTTKKPLTTYETTLPGIIIKRPTTSATPTRKPSTSNATKRPTLGVTTKKPSAASSVVTKRPSPSIITASKKPTTLATTRRPSNTVTTTATSTSRRPSTRPKPKPTVTTRRTTTTTEVTDSVPESDEITEQVADISTPDFRKECGVRPLVKRGGKIVGGKGSQFGYYPWQVLVRESTWLGLFTKNKCGGVLITNRYVITAAHCQPGFLASLVAVFGEYDISGELESRRSVAKNVRRVIVHRQYDPATFENDLALLELDSPIAYDEHIVPICMPRDGEDYVGRMATVTGWGRLKYGGGVPSVLQEVRVPLIENSVCQEMFQTAGHQKRIISSFLCAGYANGQKDSCEGDSGGPLMVEREDGRWVLLGTVSHGIKCAAPYLPGVYMRTTYYKPWLKSITGVST